MNDAPGLEPNLEELASIIAQFANSDGSHQTAIPGLWLYRQAGPSAPTCGLYESALVLAAQGAKRVMLAGEAYDYDRAHYLVTSVDLPVISQVTQATPDSPYLCLLFKIDPGQIRQLMAETGAPQSMVVPAGRGISVSRLSAPLLDAALRLARLLRTPQDIPILGPLIEREILYRLLTGEDGMRLRHIAVTNSQSHQIARAIDWLKANYVRPLRIEDLAQRVNMSASSLHHHFKAMTAMSPLQYQKQLRLQEARRLMLAEMLDAGSASHRVGYESPSQFSREYARVYGTSPARDVSQLRAMSTEAGR